MQGQRWAGSLQENRSAGREGVCKKEGTSLSQDHHIPAVNGHIDLNIHMCAWRCIFTIVYGNSFAVKAVMGTLQCISLKRGESPTGQVS